MTFVSVQTGSQTPSPCVGVCQLDEQERCTGCGRTMSEIFAWPLADEAKRRSIVIAAAARQLAIAEGSNRPENPA